MAVFETHSNVNIWWFPLEFCQSRHGNYCDTGTNSCTLISLIMADKMAKERVFNGLHETLPTRVVEIFGEAMNEGNIVYGKIFKVIDSKRKKKTPNLNIPEAMTALEGQRNLRFNLREWFYLHLTANPHKETYKQSVPQRITKVLRLGVQLFMQKSISNSSDRNLFAALIADNRTTVFIFEFTHYVVYFFDSHQHGQAGAVAAQVTMNDLSDLSYWFVAMIEKVYNSRPSIYEISFLTSRGDAANVGTQS